MTLQIPFILQKSHSNIPIVATLTAGNSQSYELVCEITGVTLAEGTAQMAYQHARRDK